MYKQLDGVAMGSPLGPALANIFVGFHESRLFDNTVKPGFYFRFVDDTFAFFGSEVGCDHFQEKLNLVHPALKFTVEKEQNNSLNFLDVLVEKEGTGFLTSIYRKLTLTGQYIRWNSFSPKMRKISLIKTLVHRALMICSKTKLGSELDKIKQLLIEDGQSLPKVLGTPINLCIISHKNIFLSISHDLNPLPPKNNVELCVYLPEKCLQA